MKGRVVRRQASRRIRLVLAAFAVIVAVLAPVLSGPRPAQAAAQRPNVLIFLADDQPAGTLRVKVRLHDGSFRREDVMRNVLEKIAGAGITFSRGYVSNPLCCPSRSTILTGLYSKDSGVYTNGGGTANASLGGDEAFEANGNATRTIPYFLDGAGYETALFGKYLNGYRRYSEANPGDDGYFIPAGWDRWRAFYEDNGKYYDYDLISWETGGSPSIEHHAEEPADYSTTVLGRQLRSWLTNRDPSTPFFAYVAPATPHPGARAAPRDIGRFRTAVPFRSPALNESAAEKADMPRYIRQRDLTPKRLEQAQALRRKQLDSLYSFDRQIGRTLSLLESLGTMENTIVVYLSDNGLMWGEHDWTYKLVPYERSTHVPFYLRFDDLGGGAAGVVDPDLVVNADLAPTIYDLALDGFRPGFPLDGVNMLTEASNRRGIYLEHLLQGGVPSYCGLVSADGWKYVVYEPSEGILDPPFEDELYELSGDPRELVNHADQQRYAAVKHAMQVALAGVCSLPDATADWYEAWQP